jgi:hypothetical protein
MGDAWISAQAAPPNESRWVYAIAVFLIFQVISTTRTFPAYMKRYLDGRGVKDC